MTRNNNRITNEKDLDKQVFTFSLKKLTEKLAASTVQFFRYKTNTRIPVGHGTGVLVKRDNDYLILTSAHVIADGVIKETFINLHGDRSLNLSGPYCTTNLPDSGKREDDLFDIGIILLRNNEVEDLKTIGGVFLDFSFIKLNHKQSEKDYIITLGFPANKLKLKYPEKMMQQQYLAYPNYPVVTHKSKNGRVTSENHILVPYERKNLQNIQTEEKIIGPYPHGMSGGGMWLFKEVKPLIYSANLIGIVNEINYKRSYFIGTKIDFHIQALNENYDTLMNLF